ncbi:MAG: roadblock/LC7 domain-containing protein [Myxococcota bacterium]|nr:roadblock/LC7 domain-containing protein [Myxococcota bacterium]
MSFEPTLQKMVDGCPGAIGIALMGSDGIPVAQLQLGVDDSGEAGELGEDVGAAGVEFGRILDEMRKAADALSAGRLNEAVVGLSRYWLLFRTVDDELFVVLALLPDANVGKARFLVRRHLLELQEQL